MFALRSARARATLAGAVFMLALVTVAGVSAWRALDMRQRHHSLEHRTEIAAALDNARAESLTGAVLLVATVFVDDPTTLLVSYRDVRLAAAEHLDEARAMLARAGDTSDLAHLDELLEQADLLQEQLDPIISLAPSAGAETRLAWGRQYFPQMWPGQERSMGVLEEMAREQQVVLSAEVASADRAGDVSLALLIGFSAIAFLTGTAALIVVIQSVLRPLASLQASVRAIASGDLEARAKVAGPQEVASLARDFNEMIDKRRRAEETIREQSDFLQNVLDSLSDPFYVIDAKTFAIKLANNAAGLDGPREGATCYAFTHRLSEPCASQGHACPLEEVKKTKASVTVEHVHHDKDGRARTYEIHCHPILDKEGNVKEVIESNFDITERKLVEEALQESEVRYKALFTSAPEGMLVADLQTRQFRHANPAMCRMFGYTEEEFLRIGVADIHPKESLDHVLAEFEAQARGEKLLSPDLPCQRKDGSLFYANVNAIMVVLDGRGCVVRFFTDVTEHKQMEEALRELAHRDALTGLLNHGAITKALHDLTSGDQHNPCAVVMIDIDGMKAINDTYGHQVGDAALQAVAAALSKDSAIVGRYGGDEFAAILPGADRQAAERYREGVLAALRAAELCDPESGASVPVSASIGLVVYPAEADRMEELVKLADDAMYAAKRQRPVGAAGKTLPRPLGSEHAAKLVGEMVPFLTSAGDLDNKLRLVAHRLSVGAGYDGVYFSLFGPHSGPPLASSAFARVPDELIEAWQRATHAHRGEPDVIRAQLNRGRRPIIMEDVQSDERLDQETRNLLRAAGLRSALIAPMLWRNELIGSLSVSSKQESAFGPRDAQFLMAIATEVTAIVRMATLVEELQSTSGHLARARAEAVIMLAAVAEFHDLTTGLHLQNVRAMTEALARELGHSEEEASELGLAAVLHDIGKVRVPDSVLNSTGPLADEEWELMKHHTTWGGEFLAGRPGFELATIVARSHHERWDGSGYPHGLAGEDIPEAATIVSVADAFDAMTSDRPYRTARSLSAAVREIVAGSGKQFSPRVVEALVRLRRRKMLPLPHRHALEQVAA